MERVRAILAPTPLPNVVKISQSFPAERLADPIQALREAMRACPAIETIRPGMRVAVTVGSRGITMLPELTRAIVETIASRGAFPFIVPAMGSHGGATAEGQKELLTLLGVTEKSVGCPINSSMETVHVGDLDNGMPVMLDKLAAQADGIIIFNRIKPHNSFRADIESGLAKMLAIGLGKQSGAHHCHSWGMQHMGELIEAMARMKLQRCKILMAVGTVENAYDEIARIPAYAPEAMIAGEKETLAYAKASMPRLLLDPLDVLVVDKTGKEFSGGGLDANIVGTCAAGIVMSPARITRVALLDVSDKSHGNALGTALADITTRRLFDKADFAAMYINALTSKIPAAGRMPMVLDNDRLAIQAAVMTSTPKDIRAVRLMRVPNTLHLHEAYISEALLGEAARTSGIGILSAPGPMRFDDAGNLADGWGFAPSRERGNA